MNLKKVLLIHGPNFNMLGKREPEIYGTDTLEDLEMLFTNSLGEDFEVQNFQSNFEGELVEKIHEAYLENYFAIVINAGALTHYSYSIFDALEIFKGIKVEVHISNIYEREEFRHKSVISPSAEKIIVGQGINGYKIAAEYIKEKN